LGCSDCCVDGISVFEIEAERICHNHERLLETETPHPEGACAFLDQAGACRVYPQRPYVCRTQGLPLSWVEESPLGAPTELRDICVLNEPGPPIESLDIGACWRIGPVEGRLAQLQARFGGGELRRVGLRDLFESSRGPAAVDTDGLSGNE
jgi:hypothetical protein